MNVSGDANHLFHKSFPCLPLIVFPLKWKASPPPWPQLTGVGVDDWPAENQASSLPAVRILANVYMQPIWEARDGRRHLGATLCK